TEPHIQHTRKLAGETGAYDYVLAARSLELLSRREVARWGRDFDVLLTPTSAILPPVAGATMEAAHAAPDQPVFDVVASVSLTACKSLDDYGVPHTCFEASDDVGGNWYFQNPNGVSSAYRSLHIDISKPSISFRDFPMPDHYPDYPHHTHIFEWLRDYADAFG